MDRVTASIANENGYHYPIDIMTDEEVSNVRDSFDALVSHLGNEPNPSYFKQLHLFHEWAYNLVTDPRILDVVESLLGPNILVHSSSIFCKYPNNHSFIPWHQDGVYWGLNKPKLWSVWLAISDSNIQNGCMRVIPKTHIKKFSHFEQKNDKVMLSSGLTITTDFEEREVVNLELKPGQISLHHLNIAHSSESNKSRQPRIGFAIRYISTDVKQKMPHFDALLARGVDTYGHYSLLSEPPGSDLKKFLQKQMESRIQYDIKRNDYLQYQDVLS